jgi:predicted adenylyl cyclase CyaB
VPASPCRNLELKARYADLAFARTTILRLGARPAGVLLQTDTYFRVPSARLKLRRIQGQPAELIWYERPDQSAARICRYHVVPVTDADGLEKVLTAALGVRGEVRKRREICLWYNVRIHLDEVAGLGSFVEFEAVLSPDETEASAHDRLDHLCRELTIGPADIYATSYSDLLGL